MDCSKRRASALGDLPVDPLVEILSRVPAKSVCRFKCVSKAWRDLIADPEHREKLPQAMEGLFCMTCDKSSNASSFSFIDLTARSVPLDIDPSFSFLTELPGILDLALRGSCNGLILFAHYNGVYTLGYVVCNPTTKEWQAVRPCGSFKLDTHAYLAFDPAVSFHFNLVQFQVEDDGELCSVHAYSSETGTWSDNQIDQQGEEGQLQAYSSETYSSETGTWSDNQIDQQGEEGQLQAYSSETGTWSDNQVDQQGEEGQLQAYSSETGTWSDNQIDQQGEEGQLQGWRGRHVNLYIPSAHLSPFVNCFLHMLVWDQDQLKIVAVDVQGKAKRMISLPDVADENSTWYFGESQGHLHYMTLEEVGAYKLSIWVLQGYYTKEWVLKHTVDTHELSKKDSCVHSTWEFEVVNIHQDCNVVFLTQDNRKLLAYGMSNKEVSVIATFDDQKWFSSTARYVPCFQTSPVLTNKH